MHFGRQRGVGVIAVLRGLLEPLRTDRSDYAFTLCSEFVVMVGQFLLYRVAARTMDPLGFSELAVARRITGSAQSLLLFGLSVALPRYMGLVPPQNRASQYPKYLSASLQSIAVSVLVATVLLLAFGQHIAYFIWGDARYATLVGPLSMMLVGLTFHGLIYSFFRGDLQMRRANVFHIINIGVVPVVIVATVGNDTRTVLMRMGFAWTLFAAAALLFTPIRHAPRRSDAEIRELLGYGLQRVPGDIMSLALATVPVALTAHMSGVVEAGFLSFAMTVVFSIAAIFSPVSVVLLPKASRMLVAGETEKLRGHVLALLAIALSVSAVAVFIGEATAGLVIPAYLGARLAGATTMVRLVLPSAVAFAVIAVLRGVVDAMYQRAAMTVNTLVGCMLFGLITGLSYVHRHPEGIAVGFVVGSFAICILSAVAAWRAINVRLRPSRSKAESCDDVCYSSAIVELPPLSREARSYALKELARRAGVSNVFFREWRVQHTTTHTFVELPGCSRKIRFPHADSSSWSTDAKSCVGRTTWMFAPERHQAAAIDKFVIPFVPVADEAPLFRRTPIGDIECTVDLLTSILLTLSRFEELVNPTRDPHGRFLGSHSVAAKHDFLFRPIVDEYGFAFEQAIRAILPAWRPAPREMYVKITHDVDHVGIPFTLQQMLAYGIRSRSDGTATDLLVALLGRSEYLSAIPRIVDLAQQHGLRSALYWKASSPGRYDSGYNPSHPWVRTIFSEMERRGCEIGFHAGYETFLNPSLLAEELTLLRVLAGPRPMGGRQHYLRWHPTTWLHWEGCGLTYDSSVGYSDQVGFRAGTCIPYHPWLFSENREARLLEVPLIAMDTTLITHKHQRKGRACPELYTCIDRCEQVGGVFVLLWHNSNLSHPCDIAAYESILARLTGRRSFDSQTAELLRDGLNLSHTSA